MKRNKKIITFISLCLLMGITGCSKETMNIKNESLILEYGETISTDIHSYIDNSDEYISEATLSNIPDNEKDKEYPSIGEYEIKLVHGKEEGIVKVIVQDTIKPEFTKIKDKYEVEFSKTFDKKQIKAKDLSEVNITVNDQEVDYKKSGDYKVVVKAEDKHGNVSEKEIVVTVKEEVKKEEKVSNSNNTASTSKPYNNQQSTTKPSQQASSQINNKPSSSSQSSSSSANNNQDEPYKDSWVIEVPEVDMSTHVHEGPAVENMYFDTLDELDVWAESYYLEQIYGDNPNIGSAYGVADCPCGKVYIHRFY